MKYWNYPLNPVPIFREERLQKQSIYLSKIGLHAQQSNCKEWALCSNPLEYIHSSAKFHITGEQGFYPVTNFTEMEDVTFSENNQHTE